MSSDLSQTSSQLAERLRFEELMSDLSSRFVNLEPRRVDDEIEHAQRRICECLDVDVSALWQRSGDGPREFTMTHHYRAVEGPPVPDEMDARDFFPWCLDRIMSGGVVRLPMTEDAPPEAARDLEVWQHFDIKSVLGLPLLTGGGPVVGVLSFDTIGRHRSWPDALVKRLELVAQIFANALAHKRSDLLLRESEERLNLAADCGEIGMWVLDVDNRMFWANERARSIFGFSADTEITMELFLDSVSSEWREPVLDVVREAIRDGCEIDLEYEIVLGDGQRRWIHSRGKQQAAVGEKPERLLGASVDVTARRQAEEEIKRSCAEVERLRRQLELENAYLQAEHRLQHGNGRVVGESPAILKVLGLVEQVAPTTTTVLIQGETGTGKELIAQRIHELSRRRGRSMVKVNCAALPSTLVESELFGREKGAYTGAVSREAGRFEVADGSTIFLDEIAELPHELQSKLLRVLEEGQFERVGSSRTHTTDVRVIAATNRDLDAEVEESRFRRDLFFRLAVFPIDLPPLRDRCGDIPLLVWAIVHELSLGMNKSVERIRQRDMERLQRYDWPGNVRELRNVVERAMILGSGPVLRIEPPVRSPSDDGDDAAVLSMEEAQRRHILKALEAAGGRVRGPRGAAELLRMKRSTLRSRMLRLGLDPKTLQGE